MSQKLVKQLADAGLSSLQAVLEHLGILTFSCDLACRDGGRDMDQTSAEKGPENGIYLDGMFLFCL